MPKRIDWRQRLLENLKSSNGVKIQKAAVEPDRRYRIIMDNCMIAATFLAALGTCFAGGVALFQYWNMEKALTIDGRNKVFTDYITASKDFCRAADKADFYAIRQSFEDGVVTWAEIDRGHNALETFIKENEEKLEKLEDMINVVDIWMEDELAETMLQPIGLALLLFDPEYRREISQEPLSSIFSVDITATYAGNCLYNLGEATQYFIEGKNPKFAPTLETYFAMSDEKYKGLRVATARGPK